MTPDNSDTSPRILVAPNAFKGWLTAHEAAEAIAAGVRAAAPSAAVEVLPVADGGDGTLDVLVGGDATGGAGFERRTERVSGPMSGQRIDAAWGWRASDRCAAIEMAEAAGLRLLRAGNAPDPMHATTRGVGELIASAIHHGAARIVVGVGGSATVDGGLGALVALGWRFLDAARSRVEHAADLPSVVRHLRPGMRGWHIPPIEVLCDVTNPLLGPRGAARVFGPQKGADAQQVAALEAGLARLAETLGGDPGAAGAGAAGGLAYGLSAALGARLVEGGVALLELLGMRRRLADAALVITGEGKLDEQTLDGKAPAIVARMAAAAGRPCVALAGRSELREHSLFARIDEAAAANPAEAAEALRRTAERLTPEWLRLIA